MAPRKTKSCESSLMTDADLAFLDEEESLESPEASSIIAEETVSLELEPELEPEPEIQTMVAQKSEVVVAAPVTEEPQESIEKQSSKTPPTRPAALPKRLPPRNTPRFSKFLK